MPLFGRADGKVVKDATVIRRIMPYLMPTRNGSLVFYELIADLTDTLPFIEAWNAKGGRRLTLFQVVLAAVGRMLLERPGLNRFISGNRIYQRNQTQLAFTAKKRMEEYAPSVTLKLDLDTEETLETLVERIGAGLDEARADKPTAADKEAKSFLMLPGFLLRWVVGLGRWLDARNLLPHFIFRDDPLYASAYFANLGSLGIDRVWHHLYEWGNCGLFCAIGKIDDQILVVDGEPVVRKAVRLRFTYDERVNDGHYCGKAIQLIQGYVEKPELLETPAPVAEIRAADSEAERAALEREKAEYAGRGGPTD